MKIIIPILILILAGCSSSLVYSPSMNLGNETLKEKQVDLQGGVEMLPETRPDKARSNSTVGLSGHIAYGFSDKFNLSVKSWLAMEQVFGSVRGGYSLNGQFISIIDAKSKLVISPKMGIAMYGSDIQGYGFAGSALYHRRIDDYISWYGGAGLLWGYRDLEKQSNDLGEQKLPMGIGLIGNVGFAWEFTDGIRLNCEISPLYQINSFDDQQHFILSPHIGFAYTFDT